MYWCTVIKKNNKKQIILNWTPEKKIYKNKKKIDKWINKNMKYGIACLFWFIRIYHESLVVYVVWKIKFLYHNKQDLMPPARMETLL